MDKIMSARIDEATIQRIGMLARKLGKSKKAILEEAISDYADKIEAAKDFDILSHTFGAWRREEPAEESVRSAKDAMRRSLERYKR